MIRLNPANKYYKYISHVWVASQPYLSLRDNKVFTLADQGSPVTSGLVWDNYGRLGMGAAIRNNESDTKFRRLQLDGGTIGVDPVVDPDNCTFLTIFRTINDGTFGGTSDATPWSRADSATTGGSNDFDFMLGLQATDAHARFRFRAGGTVTTVVSSTAVQSNALNLLAIAKPTGSNWKAYVIREDGVAGGGTGANSNSYTPVAGRDLGVGARWMSSSNWEALEGDVLFCMALNKTLVETELRDIFANPWQIFKPQVLYMPMIPTEIVVAGEGPATTVFITDVNATESWTDGDTALPITGSGFA